MFFAVIFGKMNMDFIGFTLIAKQVKRSIWFESKINEKSVTEWARKVSSHIYGFIRTVGKAGKRYETHE